MSSLAQTRLTLALVALAAAAAIVPGVASGAEDTTHPASAANAHLLLGVTGNASRFKGQTGQESSVVQAFLGWGQGQTYGAPFASFFDRFGPIPMLHLGTGGGGTSNRKEAISPQQIAQGKGDSYLVALNNAI